MALVLADRVKETTTTAGTGTVTLLGASAGFQSFAVVGNANTTYYTIAGQSTSEWEVGIGTYTSAGTLLARTTVLSNSSATEPSALNFAAGTKDVFVTYPSSKSVNLDASGNATALGTPVAFVGTNITGTASGLTAGNVTTNANLTGDVTSVGNATAIAAGVIVDADINASAGIVDTKLATISTALKVSNSATTATNANTASAIVARDASGNFTAGIVTATNVNMGFTSTATAAGTTTLTASSTHYQRFTGVTTQTIVLPVTSTLATGVNYAIENASTGNLTVNSSGGNLVVTVIPGVTVQCMCIGTTLTTAADWDPEFNEFAAVTGTGSVVLSTSPTLVTPALGTPSALVGTNITGTASGLTAGNVTTNANLTGDVTSVGNATSIAAGVIVNADINAAAGIVDTKLATISTASKVSNSATTATNANTASAIVARDASGNFSAGTITAALTGNASGSAATFTSTSQNSQFNSVGVGTAGSGTAGEIRATNNITAFFSDERLKTKTGDIENALDKVCQIETMLYHANEVAVALGYNASIQEVGVTAQSVQKVQPEIVVPAPIDDKYLTVRYEKLVPLLIEAIKELNAKVAALEQVVAKSTQG